MANWYLTGMPGSGKTTLGRRLAEQLGWSFCDLDACIVERTGKSIPEIFAEQGEEAFRRQETLALERVSQGDRQIISTGGGTILRMENVETMQKSGRILFVDRPLDQLLKDIDIEGRPLLAEGKDAVQRLYAQRYALYLARCDRRIVNAADEDQAMKDLMTCIRTLT